MGFIKSLGIGVAKPLPDGEAHVEFDAGGQATFVTPNPVRPILVKETDGKEMLFIRWTIADPPLHSNSGFEVVFGNVVPCHQKDAFLQDLHSEPEDAKGRIWTWKWPVPDQMPPPEDEVILFYDLFFVYQPKQLLGNNPRPKNAKTLSLRQILSADPTLILPPKAGGG